jgi:hypothetical protein
MKIGERVIYTEGVDPKTKQPLEYEALVLGERNIADHMGEDDEPLLTLVFVKERLDPHGIPIPLHGTGMQERLIQTRLDVAHESHAYTKEQQQKYEKTAYEGGRWREAATPSGFEALRAKLASRESELSSTNLLLASARDYFAKANSELVVAKAEAEKFRYAALTHLSRAEEAEGKLLSVELTKPADNPTPEPEV